MIVDVSFLDLCDKAGKSVRNLSAVEKKYNVRIGDGSPVRVLRTTLNTTMNSFTGNSARLYASIQLENFISDFKNNPQGIYDLTVNGEVATEAELDFLYEQGIRSVRLPVTWFNHMDSTGTVDPEWFDEVNSVVNRLIDKGFYVIVDIHHDTGFNGNGKEWLKADRNTFDKYLYTYKYLVLQIAENFKHYDEHLILEGPNEVTNYSLARTIGPGSMITNEDFSVYKTMMQIFVDEVRNTGYNNTNRFLIINTYNAARLNLLGDRFELPYDDAENKIFVGLHDYTVKENGLLTSIDFLKSEEGQEYLNYYNIILGEFGVKNELPLQDRIDFMTTNIAEGYDLGIPMFLWDDGLSYAIMTNDNQNPAWNQNNDSDKVAQAMIETHVENIV